MPLLSQVLFYVLTTLAVCSQTRAIPIGARLDVIAEIFTLPSGGITLTFLQPVSTPVVIPPATTTDDPLPTATDDPVPTANDSEPDNTTTSTAAPINTTPANTAPANTAPRTPSSVSSLSPSSSANASNTDFGASQTNRVSVSVLAIIVILSIIAIITAFIGLIFYVRTRRNGTSRKNVGANAIGGVYGPPSGSLNQMQESIRTPLNQSFGNGVYGAAAATSYVGGSSSYSPPTPAGRLPIQYGAASAAVGRPAQSGQGATVYYTPQPTKPVRPQNPFADVTPSNQSLEAELNGSTTATTSRTGRRVETPTLPPLGELPLPPAILTTTGSGSRPTSPGGSLWVSRKLPPGGLSPATATTFKF